MDQIVLRPLVASDLPQTHKWHNDVSIQRKILSYPPPISLETEKEWLAKLLLPESSKSRIVRGIELNRNQELIGLAQLDRISEVNKNAYLGIFIGELEYQGQGMGQEALDRILAYAFRELGLKKISLEVVSHNSKALNFYKKNGFIEEGILKRHVLQDNEYFDLYILSKFECA